MQRETDYSLHSGAEIYLSSLKAGTASIKQQERCKQCVHFNLLPVGVHLTIFSYLDVASLCHLAQTCTYLSDITSDPLLWKTLLQRDVKIWPAVGHLSHPHVYEEVNSDLSPKHIYSQCFKHRSGHPPTTSLISPFTSRLKSFMRRLQGHIQQVVVFGSGLESLPFIRNLLWESSSPYSPVGLSPGKDGVGSGVCVQHGNTPINLVTLYTASKVERRQCQRESRARVNKLVTSSTDGSELTHAVHELCRQANGFILVVNSASLEEGHDLDVAMLNAMLHSSAPQCPLLVLAAHTSDTTTLALSPVHVANSLDLCSLPHHPWLVRSLPLETFEGLSNGVDWLLQMTDL